MRTIAVLLTVHNRKEKTLKCLCNLYRQEIPAEYNIDVYLTDDGCTDGTPEAVKEQFPQVNIMQGDGTLFWNRGMYMAWKVASETKDYDAYVWLNDDTFILDGGINEVLLHYEETGGKAIIVASVCSAFKKEVTYGGHAGKRKIFPNGELQNCDTFNGNFVLIPQVVFKSVGNLDRTFRHAIGDLDYGYRTRKAGFTIYASKDFLATCELNPRLPKWARKDVPFKERLRNLYSPLGYAEPIPFFYYECRNFGALTAIKHFMSIHLRVLLPGLWKNH